MVNIDILKDKIVSKMKEKVDEKKGEWFKHNTIFLSFSLERKRTEWFIELKQNKLVNDLLTEVLRS